MNPIKLIVIALALAAVSAKHCPAGNYKKKSGACLPCPKGTFQPKANRYACKPCPHDKIAREEGSTKCTSCPKNTEPTIFKHRCVCIPGAVRMNGKCRKCKPGTFFESGTGYRFCSVCNPGTFQRKFGQFECLDCSDGQLSGYGAKECITCEDDEGFNINDDKCEKCKAGYGFNKYSGCQKCERNRYKPKAGLGPCLPCPIGTHSLEGAKECTPCPKGKVLLKDGKCGSCDAGSYFNKYEGECMLCGNNQFTPYKNVRTSCFDCSGKRFSMEGATKCIRCPKGKFLVKSGKCRKCPQGSVHIRYELKCQKCEVNSFTRGDMDYCETCPDGTYALPGSTTCFTCPKGKALILKKKKCGTCKAGFSYTSYIAKCDLCYEGSIKKNPGLGDCKSCPSGMTSNDDRTECVPLEE